MNVKIGCNLPFDAFFTEPSPSTLRFLDLCDTSRSIETMWSSIHCDLVQEELPNFHPAYFGEWLPL